MTMKYWRSGLIDYIENNCLISINKISSPDQYKLSPAADGSGYIDFID